MKVLVTDGVAEEGIRLLRQHRIEVDVKPKPSPQELEACIANYEGLIVRSATKVTAELIEAAARMKVIGRAGAGVDNIDLDAATQRGIVVMNTPGGNTISTAEHAFSLLLALSRNISQASAALKGGMWDRTKYTGVEVFGKTLGIIGVGKVGKEVAIRANAFGMKVLGHDPFLSEESARTIGVSLCSLGELYAQSDYITIHAPLTEQTFHLISDEALSQCKDGVRIIQCARGGIVDEAALLKAIESGKVAGAALDVFETEPAIDNPLLARSEVIGTPHLGASTTEAQTNVAIQIAEQIIDMVETGAIRNAVNLPPLDSETYSKIKPYMDLSEKLGSFLGQLATGQPVGIRVEYHGDLFAGSTVPLTSSVIKGTLQGICRKRVNIVNAPIVAKEHGVKVNEVRSSGHPDYTHLITVSYATSEGTRCVSGTIFGISDPKIVRMREEAEGVEYHLDAVPEGEMVVCSNMDTPGTIGRIGMLMAEHQINIARMSWGRQRPGGNAITVLNLDSPAPRELLREMEADEHILWAKAVRL